MKQFLYLALVLIALSHIAVAGGGEFYVNGSEPAFLEDIGPQDERADNPLAALVVSLGVIAIIYNGLRRADKLPEPLRPR